jgi:neutral trehalase
LDASQPSPEICDVYRKRASRDALSLRNLAEERAKESEAKVKQDLLDIGEKQAKSLRQLLQEQFERIRKQQGEVQRFFEFSADEKKQRELDQLYWAKRLEDLEREIESEPELVRQKHEISARRVEPVGLVYLLPEGQK